MKLFLALVVSAVVKRARYILPSQMRKRSLSELALSVAVWGIGISSANLVSSGRFVVGVLQALSAYLINRLLERLDTKRG
jgi:hypothetical protein